MQTRIFGRLRGTVTLPMVEEEDGAAVDWRAPMAFPGLRPGEKLTRETTLPERGDILARDGTPLAKGPNRLSDLGPLAAEVAGRVGPAPPERAAELARRGVPEGAPVGLNGLEREFDERLAGSPGGILRAGSRVDRPRRGARRRRREARRSTPTSSAPRSRRWPGASAGSPCCGPRPARCSGCPASPSPRPSRRARPSRSSRSRPRSSPARSSRTRASRSRRRRRSRASSSRTPTARRAAARSSSPSPTPATPCSRRWAPRSGAKRLVETAEQLRLQPGPRPGRRGPLDDPRRGRDRRRPGGRLDGDRPGQGARHPAGAGHRGGHHRAARPPRRADALARLPGPGDARDERAQRARDRALHARRGHVGDRRRRRRPGRQGGGQDRHRRAAQHRQRGPGPGRARRRRRPRSRRRTRPTPTRGSWASRPTASRRSRSRCCWSARARAARRPRRPPTVIEAALDSDELDVEVDDPDVLGIRRAR